MTPMTLSMLLAAGAAGAERFEFEEPHMGTVFRVVLYAPDGATAGPQMHHELGPRKSRQPQP